MCAFPWKRWTKDEDAEAVRLAREGFTAAQIGERLGRTERAVRWRLWGLGFGTKQRPGRYREWTQQEKDRAAAMRRDGRSCEEIGEALGRSPAAVMCRLSLMGVRLPEGRLKFRKRDKRREPTEAELDALIAERRATMPEDKDHPRDPAPCWRVPVLVVNKRWNGKRIAATVNLGEP